MSATAVTIQCPRCERDHRVTVREVAPYRPATRSEPAVTAVIDVEGLDGTCVCGESLDTPAMEAEAITRAAEAACEEDDEFDDLHPLYTIDELNVAYDAHLDSPPVNYHTHAVLFALPEDQ